MDGDGDVSGAARSWIRPLREGAKRVREAGNRVLHPFWRSRALQTLDEVGTPSRVVFVCHGNICRSPYAEAALRRELGPGLRGRIEIESSGFIRPDRPPPPEAIDVARERSVDLAAHRSRLVETESLRRAELIFVMDPDQRSAILERAPGAAVLLLGDLDPEPAERRRIYDPVTGSRDVFREVYARIDRCVAVLAGRLEGAGEVETRR